MVRVAVLLSLVALLLCACAHAHPRDAEEEEYEIEDFDEYAPPPAVQKAASPSVEARAPAAPTTAKSPIDDEEFYDEEEFEGELPLKAPPEQEEEKEPTPATPPPPPEPFDINNYRLEALLLAGLLAYAINYVIGRRANTKIASAWSDACVPLLADNFAYVNLKDSGAFIKESESDFVLFGTGRRHCRSLTAALQLYPRFDLASVAIRRFATATDSLTIIIDLLPTIEPLVLAVIPRRSEKKMKADHEDLSYFTKTLSAEAWGLPPSMVVLAETAESAHSVLTENIVIQLDKYQHCLQYLIISDQFGSADTDADGQPLPLRKILALKFSIPRDHLATHKLPSLALKMALYLVDSLASIRLSPAAQSLALKRRAEFGEDKKKQLNKDLVTKAQQRKDEKRRSEREKAAAQGPAALQKWEEKERKKQIKDRQRSMVVRM